MRRARVRAHPGRHGQVPGGAGQLRPLERVSDTVVTRFGRRDFVLFVIFLGLSVVVLTLPRDRQQMVAGWVRGTVLAPFLEVQSRWVAERDLRAVVHRLRRERDSLSSALVSLRDVAQETERLRSLVGLASRAQPRFVAANLVPSGRGAVALQTFLLDVGRNQGIEPPAPVVAVEGMVGVVRSASGNQAAGDFWTHPDFRASTMTEDERVFGIVRPTIGTREEPLGLLLTGVPYQAELEPGARVVTSGLGGVFPRGVPVGRVAELVRTEEGWAKTYRLQPAVHPGAAVEVLVMTVRDTAADLAGLWPTERAVQTDTAER